MSKRNSLTSLIFFIAIVIFFVCSAPVMAQDNTPPTYSKNATNTTVGGQPCNFTLEWTDNVALHPAGGYLFSTNNSGTWVNGTTNLPRTNLTLKPEEQGTYEEWPHTFGTNKRVQAMSDDNDSTYIGTSDEDLNWYRDTFIIPNISLPPGSSITSVNVSVRAESQNPSYRGRVQTMLRTNGTDYYYPSGTYYQPGASWTNYSTEYTTNPNTSLPWTEEEVNNMEIGVRGMSVRHWFSPGEVWVYDPVFASEVWAVIEYANPINFTSTPQNATYVLTLNPTVRTVVAWCFYAKDNAGHWNGTGCEEGKQFTLITTNETPPTFSNNQTNTTIAGTAANFTIDVTDDFALDSTAGYIFSTNNSGAWKNSSFVSFTGSGTTLTAWNVTVLTSTKGGLVQWKFYANDTSNNWNVSETYNLTIITLINAYLRGVALYYYTGEKVDGNVTIIPIGDPEGKETMTFTGGEWSYNFYLNTENVEYLTVIVDDDQKIGYSELKLKPEEAELECTVQDISLSGYSVDTTGDSITSGDVKVSVPDTDYTNTTSFSGTWSIDFHPCLISGKIYTLQVLVSDDTGKRGEFLQKYPAR